MKNIFAGLHTEHRWRYSSTSVKKNSKESGGATSSFSCQHFQGGQQQLNYLLHHYPKPFCFVLFVFFVFFPILRYKIYFTKISRNLDKLIKFTVEFFSSKISPIILVKKARSFVKKNHWGSSSKQNDLNVLFKSKQKRHHECNNKKLQSAFQ